MRPAWTHALVVLALAAFAQAEGRQRRDSSFLLKVTALQPLTAEPRFAPIEATSTPAPSSGESWEVPSQEKEPAEASSYAEGHEGAAEEGKEGVEEVEEGAEHGEEAEHPETRAFALSLMISVIVIMAIFYLVNFRHEGVRGATWMTLNTTVSIFAAVLIYGTILGMLREVLDVQTHSGLLVLLFTLFAVLVAALQVVLYWLSKLQATKTEEAVCVLSAHIAGFAAMYFGAGLQMYVGRHASWPHQVFLFIGISVFMVGLTFAGGRVRKAAAEADGNVTPAEEAWMEYVEDVENDVVSLCVGFAAVQLVRFAICHGRMQPYEPGDEPEDHITQGMVNALLIFGIVAALLNCATTNIVSRAKFVRSHTATQLRMMKLVQATFATITAWALLFWGEWQVYVMGFEGARIEGCLFTALLLTAIALIVVLALDFIADVILHHKSDNSAMRALMVSLGLMVGFTWERCFDLGLEHLSILRENPAAQTVLRHALPWVMLAIVVPAWAWYILPKAKEAASRGVSD
mmetsp:Transcript_22924/g.52552  ORF Transcript_22924/g.52552 Transcript_22924/m.52552 type:complete len:518 (-) Transcript_22924:76-1629(-)